MSNHEFLSRGLVAAVVLFCAVSPLPAEWVNATGNLAEMPSECGNLCLLSVVPAQDKIIAGIAKQGLWQTTDGGTTWTQMGKGAGSDVIVNRTSRIVYDPTNANIFWESGIYNSSGVYRTTNGGATFQHLGSAKHIDYVSVDFFDPQRRALVAGGHEQSRTVWKSMNGGQTWTNVGAALPEGTKFSSNPLLIDALTYLVNASGWGKGTGGVYRTRTAGGTWKQVSSLEANGEPLVAADKSIYWPLMYDRGVIRSTDQGQTWTQVCGSGVIKASRIIELPDGKLAAVGNKNIKVSSDHGTTWTPVLESTPIQPSGVVYAPARQAFFIWNWDCGNKVLTNAVWRHDYRVESNSQ
jgi:photosystem II stability/assembly factor-like uncharacterized protein